VYEAGQKQRYFSYTVFWKWIALAIWHGAVTFFGVQIVMTTCLTLNIVSHWCIKRGGSNSGSLLPVHYGFHHYCPYNHLQAVPGDGVLEPDHNRDVLPLLLPLLPPRHPWKHLGSLLLLSASTQRSALPNARQRPVLDSFDRRACFRPRTRHYTNPMAARVLP